MKQKQLDANRARVIVGANLMLKRIALGAKLATLAIDVKRVDLLHKVELEKVKQ